MERSGETSEGQELPRRARLSRGRVRSWDGWWTRLRISESIVHRGLRIAGTDGAAMVGSRRTEPPDRRSGGSAV